MTDTVPPGRTAASAASSVASFATASITASAPRPPVASSTASTVGPVDGLGPRVDGPGPAPLDRVDGQHPARPQGQGRAHGTQPHGPQPEHHDRPAGGALRPLGAGPPGGQVVGQQQRRLVVHALGDAQHLEVGGRHGDGGGLAAGQHARPEHLGPLDAADGVAGRTPVAGTAPGDGRRQHPVAHPEPPDVGADLEHRAEELVAHRDGHAEVEVAVVEVQVRAADGGGVDRHHGSARPRRGTAPVPPPPRTRPAPSITTCRTAPPRLGRWTDRVR